MYMVWDLETENHKDYRRFANPFSPRNYVVARGWKMQGDTSCSWSYHDHNDGAITVIPDNATLLVGHNIKFDLLFEWRRNETLTNFFKRGGKIWDTQYVEYLLEAAHHDYHMIAMDDIVEKYGGRKKIDAVKALWEAGFLTSQIDKDMLIDYLVGTTDELRNSGDIGNTELIFLGQVKRAAALNMIPMIFARMDGLLATTEMEYNGLKIDVKEAARATKLMNDELKIVDAELQKYIPELPDGLTFNWNSNAHKSILIFGGTFKYIKVARYIDPKTGEYARLKAKEDWPLIGGVPVDPRTMSHDDSGLYPNQDVFTSGLKKGTGKFKKVDVLGNFKTKKQPFTFRFDGYTSPKPEWQGKNLDGAGEPIYFTNDDVITELSTRNIDFIKVMSRRQALVKDLGTYYVRYDDKTKDYVGMLTYVTQGDHIVHHNLNHTSTVTTRLSASNPNLQNIPRADTSEVKKMFISRLVDGKIMEIDYSQLEVVGQGLLSLDPQLCEDLRNKVDFHCKRVAYKFGVTYEEALYRCKDSSYPEHPIWKNYRTKAKEFSFQRAYGAGAAAIALSTGMTVEDVKMLIEAEEIMYPGVIEFNDNVLKAVKKSAVPFKDPLLGWQTFRRGYWVSPTGTRYTFRTYQSPEYKREREADSFNPPELKNYPIQGTCGEIVQIVLGKLWRHFLANDNYGGKALLCNTVHDCVWFDYHVDVEQQLAKEAKTIMEDIPKYLKELYGIESPVPFPVEVECGYNLYDKQVIHI